MLKALLCKSGIFRACICPENNIPIEAKKVISKPQIKPFTTPVSIDHWVVLSSFENITPRPIIPTIAPTKIGSLIGFLKNIKPFKNRKKC